MSGPAGRDDRARIAEAYAAALNAYLSGAGEAALAQAYELGRNAATRGVGVLEMVTIHHEALLRRLSENPAQPAVVLQAAQFFSESLAPFEMTLRADAALRQAKLAADAANRELESFSYSVAHDLRAPLRSIDGFSQALLEDCADRLDDRGKMHLGHVRESAQRMGQLIDGLLELSRLSRSVLDRKRIDLTALANRIVERLQAADGRPVQCVFQPDVSATGDERLLRAALENLIGNAWKFTSKRPVARIEFGAQIDRQPMVYFVRDNGAGFDMKYASKLFGVFQRLHGVDEFEGTGIGLATVQRVVQRHGGRVWAEAEADRGASFYFTLEEDNPSS